jgi:hypothetical protein
VFLVIHQSNTNHRNQNSPTGVSVLFVPDELTEVFVERDCTCQCWFDVRYEAIDHSPSACTTTQTVGIYNNYY